MPTTLRPNDIDYAQLDGPAAEETVLATALQPIPSSDQAETIVQYFTGAGTEESEADITITYRCYRYGVDIAGEIVLGTQLAGTYEVNLVTGVDADPLWTEFFLMWVDREPYQAGAYAVTGEVDTTGLAEIDGSSIALLTIGA